MSAAELEVLDTSVAVPLLVRSHEEHGSVSAWAGGRTLRLTGHSLAETYAVLTRLPGDARVSPGDAAALLDDGFEAPLTLSLGAMSTVHRELARCGVAGGASFDGLVALAAREHAATLVTRDARARPTYEAVGARVRLVAVPGGDQAGGSRGHGSLEDAGPGA